MKKQISIDNETFYINLVARGDRSARICGLSASGNFGWNFSLHLFKRSPHFRVLFQMFHNFLSILHNLLVFCLYFLNRDVLFQHMLRLPTINVLELSTGT